jgi:hypothetical protein
MKNIRSKVSNHVNYKVRVMLWNHLSNQVEQEITDKVGNNVEDLLGGQIFNGVRVQAWITVVKTKYPHINLDNEVNLNI